MNRRLLWDRDGVDWPNRSASHFLRTCAMRWHYQRMGNGPIVLLIHGTGASTHSWRDLMPALARRFDVIAVDLPGHAFTEALPGGRPTLAAMSASVGALIAALQTRPDWVIGHSAGAAIGAQMIVERRIAPRGLIALNPALRPLDGLAGVLYPPTARLLATTSLAARLFAWRASHKGAVERLIATTGSRLDRRGVALYARLLADVGHVSGALAMMAHWDLCALAARLGSLPAPIAVLAGANDTAVPVDQVRSLSSVLHEGDSMRIDVVPGVGHLAHEEEPEKFADLIVETAVRLGRAVGVQPARRAVAVGV